MKIHHREGSTVYTLRMLAAGLHYAHPASHSRRSVFRRRRRG